MKTNVEFKDIVSWIVGGLGVFAALVSAFITKINGFTTAFISAMVVDIILAVLWGQHLNELHKKDNENEKLQQEIDKLQGEVKQKDDALLLKQEEFDKYVKADRGYGGTIATNIKNVSKLNNEFCIKIPELSNNSYWFLEVLERGGDKSSEKMRNEMIYAVEAYSTSLFELYKRYSTQLLAYAIEIEEAHLRTKRLLHEISTTIKLFNKPFDQKAGDRNNIIVFTAFRDKRTYDKHEREIGQRKYTIDGNSDFVQCLQQDAYIVNNAKKDSGNYLNEHVDFDAHYNCAVVVPIKSKQSNGAYRFYGYLCCDCLNSISKNVEVFDKVSAQYLFAMAQLYSSFLDTMDSNWRDRISIEIMPETFSEVIFEKTYIN